MLTIGLTGGIGSGKSEVAGILGRLGATVVKADVVGHETYRRGQPAWQAVVDAFGQDVVGPDGEIDRSRIGRLVFGDPGKLDTLTGIVWPAIRDALSQRIEDERRDGQTRVLVIEAAVLYEAGWDDLADEVWVVEASETLILDRLEASRGMDRQASRARIRAQMAASERAERADVTIRNDGDLADLERAVNDLWRERIAGRAAEQRV